MSGFFARWKEGIKASSPAQLLEAKLFGQVGQIVGLFIAMFLLWFNEYTYFTIFLLFTNFILYVDLKRTYKEYMGLKKW